MVKWKEEMGCIIVFLYIIVHSIVIDRLLIIVVIDL